MAILSVRKQGSKGELFRRVIFKRVTTLGSANDCDLVLDHPEVSAMHAMIVLEGGAFHVVRGPDVKTVRVGGKPRKKVALRHHDVLTLGPYEIRFDLFTEAEPAPHPRSDALLDAYRRLHQFSLRLADHERVEDLLERLLEDVLELAEAEKGFIFLVSGDGDPGADPAGREPPSVRALVSRNLRPSDLADLERDTWSDTIVREALNTRRPVIVSDAMSHRSFAKARSVLNLKLASVLCIPLLHRERLLGLLYLGNNNVVNLFTAETLSVVTVFGGQAALLIHAALALQELRDDRDRLKVEVGRRRFGDMIGQSEAMQAVFHTIERVAGTDLVVLIEGETGTGKELVAGELHRRSPRGTGPFVAVNCAAIPENLLESELFGHVRGAFSGATNTHRGLFERAHRGTLFLDEIGDLPPSLQVKLLRVLQEQKVRPVGSERNTAVDVRVIAATNRDIERCVAEGSFREDLYYRLNAIRIMLPPLRARGHDVLLIARSLLARAAQKLNPNVRDFARDAIRGLIRHGWAGNVRELENRVNKALVMARGSLVTAGDLGLEEEAVAPVLPLGQAKDRFARDYVLRVLSENNGNRAKTAEELGVDPRTIYRYLEAERTEAERAEKG